MKLYISISDYSQEALDVIRKFAGDITIRPSGPRATEEELCKIVREYDAIIIGAREPMSNKVFQNATRLTMIGTLSVGVDHIDSAFLSDRRIKVLSCPDSNALSVAEHTFALILALWKKLQQGHIATLEQSGRAGLHGLPNELSGHTLGVVGAGRIATRVFKLGTAFGLKLLCHTSHPDRHPILKDQGVEFVDLPTLFRKSDVITIHIPLTVATRGIITRDLLNFLPKGAVFVNTSRYEIVDNNALFDLLKDGRILGVGIDADIPPNDLPQIMNLAGMIITPHMAGITREAISRMDIELAEAMMKSETVAL